MEKSLTIFNVSSCHFKTEAGPGAWSLLKTDRVRKTALPKCEICNSVASLAAVENKSIGSDFGFKNNKRQKMYTNNQSNREKFGILH